MPARSRLVGPAGALRVHTAAERLTGPSTGLLVFQPPSVSRMVDTGHGLLVTEPGALTAAAGEDPAPDPWFEQRLDAAADLARWERKLEAGARRALSAWTAVAATAVLEDRYLTAAAGGDQLPPDPNAIPPLRSVWQRIAGTHIVSLVSELLGEVFARFLRDEQVVSARPWQEQYLEDVTNRLSSVADSTFDLVRGVVQDGIDEGASIPDIRDRVQESLDAGGETSWPNRAQVIARTETIGAYNGGHLASWEVLEEETGDELEKVWLATIDPRTRDSHFRADGQRVPLGEQFRVGLAHLSHPGDPTGPAGEVIQCRCTMLLLAADEPTPDVGDRGFRDADEVAAEIARRAEQDPPVVRFYDDPEASLQAAARRPAAPVRPGEDVVLRMDAIYRASYEDRTDALLLEAGDEAVVDPATVDAILAEVVVAAGGFGGLGKSGGFFDPNQKRDAHGRWTRHGSAISISVKDSDGGDTGAVEEASFTDPSEALARVTWEHDDLVGSDGKTYRSEVWRVDVTPKGAVPGTAEGGQMVAQIVIKDRFNQTVGNAIRVVMPEAEGPRVEHTSLLMEPGYQGLGLGSEFNRRAEEVYRAAGATHITLEAHSKPTKGYVGGYVWARRGFGWDDRTGPRNVGKALRKLLPAGKNAEVDAVIDRLMAATPDNLADLPTPFEISELRTPQNAPGSGIGKAALLKTSWHGVRWLPALADERAADEPAPSAQPPAIGPAAERVFLDMVRDAPLVDGYDPDLEFEALAEYRTTGYRELNGHLRGLLGSQLPADQLEIIEDLRAIADRHRLPVPVRVWRGVEGASVFLPAEGSAAGTVITDPGFLSASTDRGVADRFTDFDGDSALLRITVPAGHPAIPMDALSGGEDDAPDGIGDEKELVLPPGSSLRITGEERDDTGMRILVAEVLPYGGAEAVVAAEKAKPVRRAPATADAVKLTSAQERALGWIADPKGPVPRTDVLRRLQDGGLITAPPRGWDWDKSELTPEGRAALGLPDEDAPAGSPVITDRAAADALLSALVTADLEPEADMALQSYITSGYRSLNDHLRGVDVADPSKGGVHADVLNEIEMLRGVADAHRLTAPIEAWRGLYAVDGILPPRGQAVGAVITDPAFMSVSVDRDVAANFGSGETAALLQLTVPEGHPVIPVDQLFAGAGEELSPDDEREFEVVLAPGSSLRITGESEGPDGRRVITAEVLPHGGPEAALAAEQGTPVEAPAADVDPAAALFDGALSGEDAYRSAAGLVTTKLDPDGPEWTAARFYMGAGFDPINEHLRGTVPSANDSYDAFLLEQIGLLRGLADAHQLPEPVEVWRGLKSTSTFLPEEGSVGRVLTDPGFMSTSALPDTAEFFSAASDDGAVVRLLVPAGHPALPVKQLVTGPGQDTWDPVNSEQEIALPPGSSFRIVADERDAKGRRTITAEVLPYSPPPAASADDATPAAPVGPTLAEVAAADPSIPDPPARTYRALTAPQDGDAFLREHFDPKALSKPEKEALGYWTSGNYRQVNELLRTGSLDVKVMTFAGEFEPNPQGGMTRLQAPRYETRTVRSSDDLRAVADEAAGGAGGSGASLLRLANQIDNLPAALGKHELPEDMSLFRVAALPELAHADPASLVGSTITDRGYVATSTSEKSAVLVTSEALGIAGDDAVLFEIRTPAGTPFGTPELPFGTVNGQKLGGYTRVQEVLLNPSSFRVVEVHDDTVDTSGFSLKNGAVVKPDAKAQREPTKIRRIVVELVDPDTAPAAPSGSGRPALPTPAELDALKPIDPAHIKAVERYTGRSYSSINGNLRAGKPTAATNATVKNLDAAMQPLPRDVTVHRLVGLEPFGDRAPEVGDEFTDLGFTSTSYDGEPSLAGGPKVFMELVAREGTPALDASVGIHSEEHELLIARGARTRVTEVEDVTDQARAARRAEWERLGQTVEDLPYRQYRVRAEIYMPADDAPAAPEVPATAVDIPVADMPAPVPAGVVAADGAPPIRLTAARVGALEYYAVPVGERSGRSPNYSVYMPLLRAGLIERDEQGKYVATDAGRAALTDAPAPDAPEAAEVLAPDLPADVPPLVGEAAYAAVPRLAADASVDLRFAVADYQGAGFAPLNQGLRGGGEMDRAQNKLRDRLDATFAALPPLEQPITVYRGSGSASVIFGETPLEPGTVVTDRAYLSTSTDPAVAGKFIQATSDPAVLEITVPAGARAIAVLGNEGYESEALFPRDTQLRVVSDTVERTIPNRAAYDQLAATAKRAQWGDEELERVARKSGVVVDARIIRADLLPADDRRDAAPAEAATDAPVASRPAGAPDSPADSAQAVDATADAIAAERTAAEARAEKRRAAAAKKAEKRRADEEAARAAALEERTDADGRPLKLTYDYLSGLDDDQREDLEVALIEQLAAGDPLAETRLDDLTLFNEAQAAEEELAGQEGSLGVAGVTQEINAWLDANGRPGLTHPLVGGDGATGDTLGVPSMKQVRAEYWAFLEEQWAKAEAATRGSMVTARGERLGKTGMDMFSSKRGVADVMQYASDELLEWFEQNRRITWAEFYYDRTKSPAYAARAAKDRDISGAIDRDRTALGGRGKKRRTAGATLSLVAAARRGPAAPAEPSQAQLDAYAAGRAAHAAGDPATAWPFDPAKDARDPEGLFVLWLRGYRHAKAAAFTARRAAEGLVPDPAAQRLGWSGGDVLVLEPTTHDTDPGARLLAIEGELHVATPGLRASAAHLGQTVTAAGSGPGDAPAIEGRPPMPRTWRSAPHLAPFDTPTGDGRIFKVGSLTSRELPLPLLFQPSSGMGHDGSVVVGRILAVNFTETGIEATGDYLDADPAKAPDLAKAIEQAVALTESGLGHVSVDLSDVVGELVDEDGNPVSMEDIFDAWDRGEDPKVLEQVSEGKLIACTQVATPAFEGAKIELSAAAAEVDVDAEAALEDASGAAIAVGAIVDVETEDGTIRGEVTGVDEDAELVTVQPTDDDGEPAGDVLSVAPGAVTVVTAASAESEEDAEVSLIAAAGPLRPPAAWFEDPKLPGPTALTITDDGRVFGHAAIWGSCHVGFSSTCVTPPTSPSGYKHFHVGEVVTDDGSRVAVGNLTLGGRHADVRLAYRSAIEHYDRSGSGVAVVRMYEDEFGIAFSGALAPTVTEEQLYDLRRSPVSGDWRRVGGELEMIGVLSVNSGGFNTPRFATDEAGRTALVAAPSVRPHDEEALVAAAGGKRGVLSQRDLIARVTSDVTAAVRRELAEDRARAERAARLRGLATSIKADPRSRLQRLAATVDAPRRQARAERLSELAALVTR